MGLMRGCQKAIDGGCCDASRDEGGNRLSARMACCLLVSLAMHALFMLVQVSEWAGLNGAQAMPGQRRGPSLQVYLSLGGKSPIIPLLEDGRLVSGFSGNSAQSSLGSRQVDGVSEVLPEAEPELLSELDIEIDDKRVFGFMILRLKIDAVGAVDEAEVIYSGLPPEVSTFVMSKFADAKFKPARKRGQLIESSILLRVDVE